MPGDCRARWILQGSALQDGTAGRSAVSMAPARSCANRSVLFSECGVIEQRALAVLAGGLSLLLLGGALFLFGRGIDSTPEPSISIDSLRAQYAALQSREPHRQPRFDIVYAQFPLASFRRLTTSPSGPYVLVETEVSEHLRADPSLSPSDVERFLRRECGPGLTSTSQQSGLQHSPPSVVTLLITPSTPGEVAEFRLEVARMTLSGLQPIFDPLSPYDWLESEVVATTHGSVPPESSEALDVRRDTIEWHPPGEEKGVLVPLYLLHSLSIPHTPASLDAVDPNCLVIGEVGSGVLLLPQRLTLLQPGGQTVEVPLETALHWPVQMDVLP